MQTKDLNDVVMLQNEEEMVQSEERRVSVQIEGELLIKKHSDKTVSNS